MKNNIIKRTFWEILKRFFEPIKTDIFLYIRAFIIYSLWAINGIVHIVFLEKIVSYINIGNKLLFEKSLYTYISFIILYEVLEWLFRNWGWTELATITQKNIHRFYIKKYVKLNNTQSEKIGTGKIVSIIETGLKQWGTLMDMTIEMGLKVFYTLIFTIYMIFRLDYIYGLVFIVIYIILHIFSLYMNTFVVKYRNDRIEEKHNYTKQLVKIIMSKFEILQSGKVDKEVDILDDNSYGMLTANRKMVPFLHFFFRVPIVFISIMRILVFIFLGYQVIENKTPISVLVGLSGALILMNKGIEDSVRFVKDITKEFSSITKLWDFFDTTPEIQGYDSGKDFIYKSGDIKLQNISFAYNDNKKVFENFDLDIAGGKITAFVGNSGGGKTTLVKIISQYIKQDSGNVIIDGQDLNDISLKSYYKNIGYLTQEPSVFDGSILDNLTYALETPPAHSSLPHQLRGTEGEFSKIHEIISLSKCEFIYDFPKGLETEIGERGVRLSGGQRQRLAIAKIMLKDPKIIILDEPTSALDSFSEELITKAMNNLFAGRTVLVIAHRLQTVKHADEIIVIENGEIQERGKHSELVEKNGIYNRMLELQSGF